MIDTGRQTEFIAPTPDLAPATEENRREGRRGRTGGVSRLALLLAVIFVCGGLAGGLAGWGVASAKSTTTTATTAPATTVATTTTRDAAREAAVAKVSPSVVEVYVTLAQGAALGSGVIVNGQGYIVTNNHVVSGASSIQVMLANGSKETAQLVGADPSNDLAILKIAVPQGGLSVATLGDSSQLKVGQEVLAIGNPLGDTQTVTNGIVSALKRTVSEGQGGPTISNAIQTDAPINPGNSGGALIDLQGNVVGIPTLIAIDPQFNTPANGVGFAIPSNQVKAVMSQFIPAGA
jgi:S1-C subfamily serine protease